MTMQILVIPGTELSREVRESIHVLCERAYGQDLRAGIAEFVDPMHVIGMIDDTIVSHALWITRWLEANDGAPMRTAYVEAVATDPGFQRRGYASAVMRALIAEVKDFQLAALCTSDDGQPLYTALGWEAWRGPLFVRQNTARSSTPGEIVMVHRLPTSPPLDLDSSLSVEWRVGELW
jgi:aminoglycoside 2'-N-acetyltransferase I